MANVEFSLKDFLEEYKVQYHLITTSEMHSLYGVSFIKKLGIDKQIYDLIYFLTDGCNKEGVKKVIEILDEQFKIFYEVFKSFDKSKFLTPGTGSARVLFNWFKLLNEVKDSIKVAYSKNLSFFENDLKNMINNKLRKDYEQYDHDPYDPYSEIELANRNRLSENFEDEKLESRTNFFNKHPFSLFKQSAKNLYSYKFSIKDIKAFLGLIVYACIGDNLLFDASLTNSILSNKKNNIIFWNSVQSYNGLHINNNLLSLIKDYTPDEMPHIISKLLEKEATEENLIELLKSKNSAVINFVRQASTQVAGNNSFYMTQYSFPEYKYPRLKKIVHKLYGDDKNQFDKDKFLAFQDPDYYNKDFKNERSQRFVDKIKDKRKDFAIAPEKEGLDRLQHASPDDFLEILGVARQSGIENDKNLTDALLEWLDHRMKSPSYLKTNFNKYYIVIIRQFIIDVQNQWGKNGMLEIYPDAASILELYDERGNYTKDPLYNKKAIFDFAEKIAFKYNDLVIKKISESNNPDFLAVLNLAIENIYKHLCIFHGKLLFDKVDQKSFKDFFISTANLNMLYDPNQEVGEFINLLVDKNNGKDANGYREGDLAFRVSNYMIDKLPSKEDIKKFLKSNKIDIENHRLEDSMHIYQNKIFEMLSINGFYNCAGFIAGAVNNLMY